MLSLGDEDEMADAEDEPPDISSIDLVFLSCYPLRTLSSLFPLSFLR
jgi:hypothetical protein